jgi:acyl carrier protein
MSNANDIESKVNAILIEEFEVDEGALRPDAQLGEDLDMDSLDGVDLVVALEKAFRVRISEEEARGIRTLNDIYDRVRAHQVVQGGGA